MTDLRFGVAFQAERLALIQEIARNLVGEAPPPPAINSAGPASLFAPAEPSDLDDRLLSAHFGERQATTPGARSELLGIRPPDDAVVEADAHRQALAQLAKSDSAMAAMVRSSLMSDEPAAPGTPSAVGEVEGESEPGLVPLFRPATAKPASLQATAETGLAPALRGSISEPDGSATARLPPDAATPAVPVAAAAGTAALDALASTEAVVERALLNLGLGEGAARPAAMQSELGGIIASFVLNAHFQPGWPPLRPVVDPEAKAFVVQLAKDARLSKDDIAMLTYFANFGLNRTQLARILKLVAAAANRSKLLESIAQLLANIGTVLRLVHSEVAALAQEMKEAQAARSRRERLSLR